MQKMLSACIPQAFGKNAITLDQERISRRFRLSTLYTPKNRLSPQEKLSDSAYIYRRGTHVISQATLKNPDDSTGKQND